MTDEVQNQAAPQGDPAQTPAPAVDQQAAAVVAPKPAPVVQSPSPDSPTMTQAPQPDAAAAPVVAAQTPAPEVPPGETLIQKAEDEGEDVVLDTAAGVIHAHSMVSTWLQRVEAGLHVPLDELRALKARLEKWL